MPHRSSAIPSTVHTMTSHVAMETDHAMREISGNEPLPKRNNLEKAKRKIKQAYERNVRRRISKSAADWSRDQVQVRVSRSASALRSRDVSGMDNPGFNFQEWMSPIPAQVTPGSGREVCMSRELIADGSRELASVEAGPAGSAGCGETASVSESTDSPFDRQQPSRRNTVRSRPSMRRYRGSLKLTDSRRANKENHDLDHSPDHHVPQSLITHSPHFKLQSPKEILNGLKNENSPVRNFERGGENQSAEPVACLSEQPSYLPNNASLHNHRPSSSASSPRQSSTTENSAHRPLSQDKPEDITQSEDSDSVSLDFSGKRVLFKKSVSDSSLLRRNQPRKLSDNSQEEVENTGLDSDDNFAKPLVRELRSYRSVKSTSRAENGKRKRSETCRDPQPKRKPVDFVKRNRELVSRQENVKMLRSLSSRLSSRSKTDVDKVAKPADEAKDDAASKKSKLPARSKPAATNQKAARPVENGTTPGTPRPESKWDSLARGTPISRPERRPSEDGRNSRSNSVSSQSSQSSSTRPASARVRSPQNTGTPSFQRTGLRGSGSRDRTVKPTPTKATDVKPTPTKPSETPTRPGRRGSDHSTSTPQTPAHRRPVDTTTSSLSTPRRPVERGVVNRRTPTTPTTPASATPARLDVRGGSSLERRIRSPVPKKPVSRTPDEPHISENHSLETPVDPVLTSPPMTSEEDVSNANVKTYLGVQVKRRWPHGRSLQGPRPKSCSSQNLDQTGNMSPPGMIEKRHSSGVELHVDLSSPVTRTQSTSVFESRTRVNSGSKAGSTRSSGDFSRGDSGLDSDLSPSATSDVTNDSISSPKVSTKTPNVQKGDDTPTNERASWALSLDNSQVFKDSSRTGNDDTDQKPTKKDDQVDGIAEAVNRPSGIPVTGSLRRSASVRIKSTTEDKPGLKDEKSPLKRTNSLNRGLARPTIRPSAVSKNGESKSVDPSSDAKRKLMSPSRVVSAPKRTRAVSSSTDTKTTSTKPTLTVPQTSPSAAGASPTSPSARPAPPPKFSRLPRTPSLDRMTKTASNSSLRASNTNLRGSNTNLRSSNTNLRGSNTNLRGSNSNLRGSNSNLPRAPSTERLKRSPSAESTTRTPLASSKKSQEPSPMSSPSKSTPKPTSPKAEKTELKTTPKSDPKPLTKTTVTKSPYQPHSSVLTPPETPNGPDDVTDVSTTSPPNVTVTSPANVTVTSPSKAESSLLRTPRKIVIDPASLKKSPLFEVKATSEHVQVKRSSSMEKIVVRGKRGDDSDSPKVSPLVADRKPLASPPESTLASPAKKPNAAVVLADLDAAMASLESASHSLGSPVTPEPEYSPQKDVRPKKIPSAQTTPVRPNRGGTFVDESHRSPQAPKTPQKTPSRPVSVEHQESDVTGSRRRTTSSSSRVRTRDLNRLQEIRRDSLGSNGQSQHSSDRLSEASVVTSGSISGDRSDPDAPSYVRMSSSEVEADEVFGTPPQSWHYRNNKKRTSPGRLVSDSGLLHFEMEHDEPIPESEDEDSSGDEVRITVKASPPQPLEFDHTVESSESIFHAVSSDGAWKHENESPGTPGTPVRSATPEVESQFFSEVSIGGAWKRNQTEPRGPLGSFTIDKPTVVEAGLSPRTPKKTPEPDPDYFDQDFLSENFLMQRGLAMHRNSPFSAGGTSGHATYRPDRYREDSPRVGGGEAPMFDDSMLKELEAGQYVLSAKSEAVTPPDLIQPSRLSALEPDLPRVDSRGHRRTLSEEGSGENGFKIPESDKKKGMGGLFRSKSLRQSGKTKQESDSTSTSTDENREAKRIHFIRKVFGSSKRRKDGRNDATDDSSVTTPRGMSPLDHNQNSADDVTPYRSDDVDEENEHDVTLTEEVETRKGLLKHKSPSFIEESEDGLIRFTMADNGSYTNFALIDPDENDDVAPLPINPRSPRAMSPVDSPSPEKMDYTPVRKYSDGVNVAIAGLNMPERAKSPPSGFDSCDLSFSYGAPRQCRSHNEVSPSGKGVKLSRTDSFRVGKKPEEAVGDFKRGAIYRGSGTMKKMVALIRPDGQPRDPARGLDLDYIKSTVERRQKKNKDKLNTSSSSGDQDVPDGCHSDSGVGNDARRESAGSSQKNSIQDIVDLSKKEDIDSLRNILSSVPVRHRNRNSRLLERPKSDNFDSVAIAAGNGSDTLDSGTGSLREQGRRDPKERPLSYGGQSLCSDTSRSRQSPSQISLSSDASSQETIARVTRSRTFSAPRPIKLRKKRTPEVRRSNTVRSSTSAPDLVALLRTSSTKTATGSTSTDASSMYLSNLQLTDTEEAQYDTMSLGSCASSHSNLEVFNEEVVMLAEAVWDHVTMDLDELPFRAGQVIQVTDMMDRDWWWGQLNDRHGWFPSQFVRPLVNQSPLLESGIAPSEVTNRLSADVQKLMTDATVTSRSRDQARTNVIKEIIGAENDYVKNLKYVNEGYKFHAEKRPELFTPEQITTVFGNVDEILSFSQEFLRLLEENIDWDKPHRSKIGRCFLDMKEGFEIYSTYCNNHPCAVAELQKLRQNPQCGQFFEACRLLQDKSMLPLEGFLLTPVQKICKYPLQLAELLKYTPKTSDESPLDYADVAEAVSCMKEIAQTINENKRLVESVEKIAVWQTTITNWQGADVLDESCVLIHTGELNKTSLNSGWPRDRVFFLFDHQLIYCKKDLLRKDLFIYKGRIHTDDCEVIPIEDGKDNQFNVTVRHAWKMIDRRKNKCYLLAARSATDKQRWLSSLSEERTKVQTGFDEKAVSQAKKLASQALRAKIQEERQQAANTKARVGRSASIRRHPSLRKPDAAAKPSVITTSASSIPVTSTLSLSNVTPTNAKSSDSKKRNWSFFGARKVHR